jgi:hypothetical protein
MRREWSVVIAGKPAWRCRRGGARDVFVVRSGVIIALSEHIEMCKRSSPQTTTIPC